ncbi:E3 ubiquitin-protein ligase RNF182 [Takifugu rubripes]|uniref:E3 ubiquitin-protein ligase RNF182 n=2 Tax=Takifugu TaxID=31032 RepID=A0A674NW08_TAKRU|nr:E3 ubiquitin-protein ligase RNF182-like [Takifugu rubripes]TWW61362.1 E3 ubiquitin-protein ligase RNF182 [Takifugu flavidus]
MSDQKEAELCSEKEAKGQNWNRSLVYTLEELECKICYNRYDYHSRKPKLLGCLHRVCAKCLKKLVTIGESSSSIVTCPFCRQETHVPEDEVWSVEDDRNLLAVLSHQNQICRTGGEGGKALASSHCSSDCLLITVMELPDESPSSDSLSMLNVVGLYRPPSLDSLPWDLSRLKCRYHNLPRCLLGALCLVYFSSLPLGIYLLMIGQLGVGVVLVSLVPFTLLMLVLYGFCQCLCLELLEKLTARRNMLS